MRERALRPWLCDRHVAVWLDRAEVFECGIIANQRTERMREDGTDWHQDAAKRMSDANRIGALGECAVAKALGGIWSRSIVPERGACDVTLTSGKRIEVKTTENPKRGLFANQVQRIRRDEFGVLVHHRSDNRLDVIGWLSGERFAKLSRTVNTGANDFQNVPRGFLQPMASMLRGERSQGAELPELSRCEACLILIVADDGESRCGARACESFPGIHPAWPEWRESVALRAKLREMAERPATPNGDSS